MTTRTTCDLDMTYYPFDVQTCSIDMFIVGHTNFWFNIKARFFKTITNHDEKGHGSWVLINRTVSADGGMLKIKFMFKRKPLFLLINIFLPIIVLALLTPIVFILPKKSGERVGYAITMLLAISVYMTIVSEHLPQHSQPMPLISVMIFVCYTLDAMIVIAVIINTKIYALKDRVKLPNICRKFVLFTRKFLTVFNCEKLHDKLGDNSEEDVDKDFGSQTLIENANNGDSIVLDHPMEAADITWKDLSCVIDKWCFVISYLLKILLPIIFFTICKTKSGKGLIDDE